MKTLKLKMLSLFFLVGGIAVYGQQPRAEVPGDHFSLEGALELFKKSASPEEFERLLNAENSKVNNLDLNGDGNIDYISVIDRNEGNVHAFILQAIISETERQDVAVIELEKLANGKAVLQITGDEDVYGIETIIEPTQEVRVNAGTSTARSVVNVWAWPSVQYVYSPYYSVWVSPWSWYSRPIWWHTWGQVAYYEYDPWWQPYRPYYLVCHTHRIVYAQRIYRPFRTTSVIVYNRHNTQIAHYRSTHRDHDGDRRDRYDRDRGSRDNGIVNRPTRDRQRSAFDENKNSKPSVDSRSNLHDRSVVDRKTTSKPVRSYSANRSDVVSKPKAERSSKPHEREVSKDRSGSVNRISSDRQTPSVKPERTRSSSGSSNGKAHRERGSKNKSD